MHQRTTRALALGGLAALTLSLTACGPTIGGDDAPADSAKLQAPTEASPKGEITIWDREGDLFKVFDEAIAAFNASAPSCRTRSSRAATFPTACSSTISSWPATPTTCGT